MASFFGLLTPPPVKWVPSGPDPGLTYRPTACGPQLVLPLPQWAGVEWGTVLSTGLSQQYTSSARSGPEQVTLPDSWEHLA